MLLADRGYDADSIRALAAEKGASANIPPKRSGSPDLLQPVFFRARNLIERFFDKIKTVGGSLLVTTSSRTTSLSCSLHQSGCGCTLMSSRLVGRRRWWRCGRRRAGVAG